MPHEFPTAFLDITHRAMQSQNRARFILESSASRMDKI